MWATARYFAVLHSAVYVLENIGKHSTSPVLYFVIKYLEDCLLSSFVRLSPCPPRKLWSGCPAQHHHWVLICDCRCPVGNAEILPLWREEPLSWEYFCCVDCLAAVSPSIGGQSLNVFFFCFLHSCLGHSSAFQFCRADVLVTGTGVFVFWVTGLCGQSQSGWCMCGLQVRTQVPCLGSTWSCCPQ